MNETWPQILFDMYRRARKFPGWLVLMSLYDNEDRRYFSMLDKMVEAKKISVDFEKPEGS